jgi:hypothetical protein
MTAPLVLTVAVAVEDKAAEVAVLRAVMAVMTATLVESLGTRYPFRIDI